MSPYKFVCFIVICLFKHILYSIIGFLAVLIFGAIFTFDRFIRDGRFKSWKL